MTNLLKDVSGEVNKGELSYTINLKKVDVRTRKKLEELEDCGLIISKNTAYTKFEVLKLAVFILNIIDSTKGKSIDEEDIKQKLIDTENKFVRFHPDCIDPIIDKMVSVGLIEKSLGQLILKGEGTKMRKSGIDTKKKIYDCVVRGIIRPIPIKDETKLSIGIIRKHLDEMTKDGYLTKKKDAIPKRKGAFSFYNVVPEKPFTGKTAEKIEPEKEVNAEHGKIGEAVKKEKRPYKKRKVKEKGLLDKMLVNLKLLLIDNVHKIFSEQGDKIIDYVNDEIDKKIVEYHEEMALKRKKSK